jgi:hypothetical protein
MNLILTSTEDEHRAAAVALFNLAAFARSASHPTLAGSYFDDATWQLERWAKARRRRVRSCAAGNAGSPASN